MSTWSKADLHIHTTFSRALMTPEYLVRYVATRTDLRLIAVTDHCTIEGALAAKAYLTQEGRYKGLDVIIGAEIKSKDGHIIGLFLEHNVPPSMSAAQTVDAIHAQGGLALAPHPFAHWLRWLGMKGVGNAIRHLPFDAVETRNSSGTEIYANYLTQIVNHFGQKLPETGGSDAYLPTMVGKTYTYFQGSTAEDFRKAVRCNQLRTGGFVCNPLIMAKLFLRRPPLCNPPS